MHENDIGIAAAGHVERLACAQRHDSHLNAAGFYEGRQQMLEKAGLFR